MKSQNKTNYIALVIMVLILIAIAGAFYYYQPPVTAVTTSGDTTTSTPVSTSSSTATQTTGTGTVTTASTTTITTPPENEINWQEYSSSTTGISFKYPANLGTNYIHTVDWPPIVTPTNNPFLCTQAGSQNSAAGQTSLVTINGNPYCVTVESQGAAGSIYYQYAYAFQKAGKTMILTFTLQYPQCENYDEPNTTQCKTEESSVDINSFADAMAQSMRYTPPISPAHPISPSSGSLMINSITPDSGRSGVTTITINGSGFTADNKVLFGGSVAAADAHLSAVNNDGTQSITMTVPSSIGPDCQPNQACPMYEILVRPATYSITIENANGTSNAVSFTVTAAQ